MCRVIVRKIFFPVLLFIVCSVAVASEKISLDGYSLGMSEDAVSELDSDPKFSFLLLHDTLPNGDALYLYQGKYQDVSARFRFVLADAKLKGLYIEMEPNIAVPDSVAAETKAMDVIWESAIASWTKKYGDPVKINEDEGVRLSWENQGIEWGGFARKVEGAVFFSLFISVGPAY